MNDMANRRHEHGGRRTTTIFFYLCAGTNKAAELKEVAEQIEESGHKVISRWILSRNPRLELDDPDIYHRARMDLMDIDACDILIAFPGSYTNRGGRHFELGYAYAKEREIWLIGKPEHAFHFLIPETNIFETWETCLRYLKGLQ